MLNVTRIFNSGFRWLWISVVVLAVDRYSKIWAMTHLDFYKPYQITSFLDFNLAYNTGAAFSFLHQASGWQNIFFQSLAAIVGVVILIWISRISYKHYLTCIGLCFILGGAIANAWDRILFQHVIDFISFHFYGWYFAIFNLADSAICLGTFLLLVDWLLEIKKTKTFE